MSQQINLYNPLLLKQKKIFSARTIAQSLGVLVLGLIGLLLYAQWQVRFLHQEIQAADKRLQIVQAQSDHMAQQLGPRPQSADLEAQILHIEAELQTLNEVQQVLKTEKLGMEQGFSPLLKSLARQTMEGLWLTEFAVRGDAMHIQGRTLKPELVADYLHRLGQEPVMQGRKFAMLEMRQPEAIAAAAGKPIAMPRYVEFTLHSAKPAGEKVTPP